MRALYAHTSGWERAHYSVHCVRHGSPMGKAMKEYRIWAVEGLTLVPQVFYMLGPTMCEAAIRWLQRHPQAEILGMEDANE